MDATIPCLSQVILRADAVLRIFFRVTEGEEYGHIVQLRKAEYGNPSEITVLEKEEQQ